MKKQNKSAAVSCYFIIKEKERKEKMKLKTLKKPDNSKVNSNYCNRQVKALVRVVLYVPSVLM